MRIVLTILGFFSLLPIIIGSLFKMQHWPGAGIMIVFGTSLFASFFCLFYLVYRIKERKSGLELVEALFLSASMSVTSIGMMFRVQHWPGAGVMLVFGLTLFAFAGVPIILVSYAALKENAKDLRLIHMGIGVAAISLAFAYNTSRNDLLAYEVGYSQTSESVNSLYWVGQRMYKMGDTTQTVQQFEQKELIHRNAMNLCQLIDDYKIELIRRTDRITEEMPKDRYKMENVVHKDNFDVPTNMLIGGLEGQLRDDQWSAVALRRAVEAYRDSLYSVVPSQEGRNAIGAALELKGHYSCHEGEQVWEMASFYHTPLIGVLNTLAMLQQSVLAAEIVALNEVASPSHS